MKCSRCKLPVDPDDVDDCITCGAEGLCPDCVIGHECLTADVPELAETADVGALPGDDTDDLDHPIWDDGQRAIDWDKEQN